VYPALKIFYQPEVDIEPGAERIEKWRLIILRK
jgi:hypothetical protein